MTFFISQSVLFGRGTEKLWNKLHCRHKRSIKHLIYPLNIDNLKAIYDSSFEIETENVELENFSVMMTSVKAGMDLKPFPIN